MCSILFILQVLRILAKAINENINDAGNKPSGRLRVKAQELLGHVTAKVANCVQSYSYTEPTPYTNFVI